MTAKLEKFGSYTLNPLMKLIRQKALASCTPTSTKSGYARFLRHWSEVVQGVYDIDYDSIKLRVYPADNACDNSILRSGIHREEDELAILRTFTKPNQIFVDIGANIGIYSLIADKFLGEDSKIFAFEPFPDTFKKLQFNINANNTDRILAFNFGIADKDKTEQLFLISGRNAGQHSTNKQVALRSHSKNEKPVEINVRPLAKILQEQQINKVNILKMDIEGSEDKALLPYMNATERTAWPDYIMLEVGNRKLWSEDCVNHLLSNNYEIAFENGENMHFRSTL